MLGDADQRIQQADEGDQRGILEQPDEGRNDAGDRDLQRLRHDDQPLRLPVVQPQRIGGLILAAGQGGQTAAHHLGDIGGREQGDQDDDPQDQVEVGARRQEIGQAAARR